MAKEEKRDWKKDLPAGKAGKKKDSGDFAISKSHLQEETVRAIFAVAFFVLGVFFILSAFKRGGRVGEMSYYFLHDILFGIGFYILPILFFILCVSFFKSLHKKLALTHSIGGMLFFLSSLALIQIILPGRGGIVGEFISGPLLKLFDTTASVIILIAFILISLLIIFDAPLSFGLLFRFVTSLFRKKISGDKAEVAEEPALIITNANALEEPLKENYGGPLSAQKSAIKTQGETTTAEFGISPLLWNGKEFTPPPLSLLEEDRGKPGVGDIKANSNIIKRTLANFGINVEMDEISIGPSITRYALKPAEGVKLSRIVGLQNDLSLALAAHPIRIEAPIPGKSLVGIEIPNSIKTTVGLGTLLSSNEFQNSDKPLLVSLGKRISGMSYFANLSRAPHFLIAGATGAGKSVSIHAIITSLLYRNSPDNLKFIMIDPKRVELTLYNKIPHLLTPVITDAKKTILALKWAAKEMDRRYDILQAESLQNIE